jgi:transcriptional antiterminator
MLNGDIPFKSVLIDDFCRERNIKKVTIKRNIKKVSSDEYDKQLKLIIKRAKELENNG